MTLVNNNVSVLVHSFIVTNVTINVQFRGTCIGNKTIKKTIKLQWLSISKGGGCNHKRHRGIFSGAYNMYFLTQMMGNRY